MQKKIQIHSGRHISNKKQEYPCKKNNNNTKSLRYIHKQGGGVLWVSKTTTHTNDGGEYNTKFLNHIECPYLEYLKYIFVI